MRRNAEERRCKPSTPSDEVFLWHSGQEALHPPEQLVLGVGVGKRHAVVAEPPGPREIGEVMSAVTQAADDVHVDGGDRRAERTERQGHSPGPGGAVAPHYAHLNYVRLRSASGA